ncbi:MAG: CHAT domain-containing protein [Candidatus Aminicenantes bacterium]|nr:CHAT domain-containing protein [Candidatus Aminicenantes bacterium]
MKKTLGIIAVFFLLVISGQDLITGTDTFYSPNSQLSRQEAERLLLQGKHLRSEGDFLNAGIVLERVLRLAENKMDKQIEIESLVELGFLFWDLGQLDQSLEFYGRALAKLEKTNVENLSDKVLTCIQIYQYYQSGKEKRDNAEYQDSIDSFAQAVVLADDISSDGHKVKCLRQLSVTYSEMDDLKKFFSLNREALGLASKINHRIEEGRCLYNIGLYYDSIENYSLALLHYEDALQIARENKNFIDQSYCLTNMSHVYIQLGNYDKSLDYLNEVLEIDRKIGEEGYVAIDLNNIGVTYQKKALQTGIKEDLTKALAYFEESLELASNIRDEKTEIQALTNIGMVHIDLKNYWEAFDCFNGGLEKAEKINDGEEIANILVNLGMVNAQLGDHDAAIKFYQSAIEKAYPLQADTILWEAHLELANVYNTQKKHLESVDSYKKSIMYLEEIRSNIQLEELKASYLGVDRRIDTYYNFIDLLVQLNTEKPDLSFDRDAFSYLERAKARAFLDRLKVSKVNIALNVDWELLKQEKDILSELSKLNSNIYRKELSERERLKTEGMIKKAEDDLEALKRKIRSSSPGYINLRYPTIISLDEVQRELLDNRTAFFEYCLAEKKSYVFVVTKRDLQIISLPDLKVIKKLVKDHLNNITDIEQKKFPAGFTLFQYLILPGLRKNIENLIFVPDDILHYLPFETLLTTTKNRDWLIKDYKIAYAPSISSLREIIQRKRSLRDKPKKQVLAIGDPIFDMYEKENEDKILCLPRLKYSSMEIEKIAGLFSRTEILKRNEASEKKFKDKELGDYKILHFATHGIIDDKNPARSSIIFSRDDSTEEDGFLQMREIFYLKLNSDLVTLSSCQTGGGQFIKGEGIEGLSRGFFYAGASAALISLWPVNDQATAQFMERFYFHLRSSLSIMNSLQKAKLELIESGTLSHPYYWAGFVVTGDAEKIVFLSYKKAIVYMTVFLLLIAIGSILIKIVFC